jgi:hypothetical protein
LVYNILKTGTRLDDRPHRPTGAPWPGIHGSLGQNQKHFSKDLARKDFVFLSLPLTLPQQCASGDMHRTQFHKRKNTEKTAEIFCLSLSKSIASTLEASAALAGTIAVNLREKGLSKGVLESY